MDQLSYRRHRFPPPTALSSMDAPALEAALTSSGENIRLAVIYPASHDDSPVNGFVLVIRGQLSSGPPVEPRFVLGGWSL